MKRGISPIVSIILIIALGIVLFLLFSGWVQNTILKGSIEKTEEKMEKELDCSGVEIDLVDVCVNSLESTSEVGLNIDVVGDDGVKGVTIKFIGADGSVETKDYDVETPLFVPNRLLAAKDKLSLDNVISNIVEVEIYPKTEKGELCKDKVESTKKIIKC